MTDRDRNRGRRPQRSGGSSHNGGGPAQRSPDRSSDPAIPDEVSASDLDSNARRDLLSLDKSNAEAVARHLVMVGDLLYDDPELALEHARAARRRAARVGVVRETAGIAAYNAGEWQEAISELRAARRITGSSSLLPLIADAERGLGRPERAIEVARSDEGRALVGEEATELRIVEAGARIDLGQADKALVTLQLEDLSPARTGTAAARLFYAYGSALEAAGRTEDAVTWFMNASAADTEDATDAEFRLMELSVGDSVDAPEPIAEPDDGAEPDDVVRPGDEAVTGTPDSNEPGSDVPGSDVPGSDVSGGTDSGAGGSGGDVPAGDVVDPAPTQYATATHRFAPQGSAPQGSAPQVPEDEADSSVASGHPVAKESVANNPVANDPVAKKSASDATSGGTLEVVPDPADDVEATRDEVPSESASVSIPAVVGSVPVGAVAVPRPADMYDALLLDLDGTVFAGHSPVPGAVETLSRLDLTTIFVTNNASRRPAEVAEHLVALGFAATPEQVVTSAQSGARLLSEHLEPGSRALVLGTDGLAQEVREAGIAVTRSADDRPLAVIQGYSPDTTWATLSEAALAIRAGALWVATNVDATLPSERGLLVGNGSLVAAVATATGQEPLVAGKPAAPLMADAIARSAADSPLVVGDRLDTDIQGAHAVGLDSLLVLTGVSTATDLLAAPPQQRPTYVAADLAGVLEPAETLRIAAKDSWHIQRTGNAVAVSSVGDAPNTLGLLPALAAQVWAWADADDIDLGELVVTGGTEQIRSALERLGIPREI